MKILKLTTLFLILLVATGSPAQQTADKPLRIAVVGMTHAHIGFLFGKGKNAVELVGVYEPNTEMAQRYAKRFKFDPALIYSDLDKMLAAVKPEAVAAFGSILDHEMVVEKCAPRGIHVMVEKPLATTVKAAEKMVRLAKKHNIRLLTNYETSWYPTTEKTFQLVRDSSYIGVVKKVVFHHGHQGPKEINVNKEFLDWLTDPIQNGGGALIDFGCYGANLMTRLMGNEKPLSVIALTKTLKPEVYPNVDDDATIVVNYPTAQAIIQASWNWPFSRKDMEVYGKTGYIIATDDTNLRLRKSGMNRERAAQVKDTDIPVYTDPFNYLKDVIRGRVTVPENGLYSMENNLMVVKILSAARESAKTGKAVAIR